MSATITSESIAAIALELLEKDGPAAVTMRRIADAVGVTPMAIYHHFANKEALLNFVTDREFAKFAGNVKSPHARASVETQLIQVMESYVDYALKRPRVFAYIFAEPRPGARVFPEDFRARRSPSLNPVADLITQGIESGMLRREDVWELALEMWAHVHGYVALYQGGRIALDEEEFRGLIRRSVRRLIRGLKK